MRFSCFIMMALIMAVICLINTFEMFKIAELADTTYRSLARAVKNRIRWLYTDRNLFGLFLSTVVLLIILPALLFCTMGTAIANFYKLPKYIWKLGYKKNSALRK